METKSAAAEYCLTAGLVNGRSTPIKLYVEPWGEEYEVAPGARFDVVARGPHEDHLKVVYGDNDITVWGWEGSVLNVYHQGVQLDAGLREKPPVPPYPRTPGS